MTQGFAVNMVNSNIIKTLSVQIALINSNFTNS
jgi:hypothetical protein